jgi:light-regulated signal transduction histidine kinase (bacteriophytochrome)
MRQLFQNLISNAIKFRKPGSTPFVSIYTEGGENGLSENYSSTCYRVVIEDNGIGFDPKYAEDIFVVFKRLHSYHEYEGTGVGLSICKKIVDRHNGKIFAKSKINEGSKFIIEFPAVNNPLNIEDIQFDQVTLEE